MDGLPLGGWRPAGFSTLGQPRATRWDVFDEVTRREGGKRAARRGVWVALSSAVQALLVLAVIVVSTRIAAEVVEGPVVDVKFVKPAAPPPPPPPPPPPAAPRAKPKPTEKPRTRPNPAAMVQPKEVQEEMKPPDPAEPPEEEPEGVEGGVVGGVVGGVAGGTGPATGAPGGIVDAPVYATAGFKKPQEAERGCVGRSVRLSDEMLDSFAGSVVGGSITVKFAIGRDGTPSQFQVVSVMRDPRVAQAIWQAVQSCRWVAGADAQGRPTPIWVILPLRFDVQ
jgi:protein TonB